MNDEEHIVTLTRNVLGIQDHGVKPPRNRRGRGNFGLNMSQIRRCQANARWFYSLYSDQPTTLSRN